MCCFSLVIHPIRRIYMDEVDMSSVRMKWLCSLLLCVVCSTSSSAALADAIDNLAAGQWYAVPNSQLRSVLPSPVPAGDPRNVIDAWSGATFDTAHNRLLLWGGGHSDYAGNELYAFSLNTLTW